jgi:hypothetical protein
MALNLLSLNMCVGLISREGSSNCSASKVLAVLRELKNEKDLLVVVLLLPEKWQPPKEDISFFLAVQTSTR